jgi:hypothetical protein
VQTRRTPFEDYNMIRPVVWEEFVKKMSTEEAKASSKSSPRGTSLPTTLA